MEQNHFEHFGIPVSFRPDLEHLRKLYLKISRENHPDYSAGDDARYESALMMTSQNNQAYRALTDQNARIKYVLQLKGHGIEQEDKLDPGFLMEMMEWNERIMEVGMIDDKAEIDRISKDFGVLEDEFQAKLDAEIDRYEQGGEESALKSIKEIYLQRKYLLRLKESIDKFAAL